MVKKKITILNESGLHARPAATLVKLASKFSSKIFLQKDSIEVSAKSIMGLMSLGAEMGSKILIIADGEDEEDALKQIYNLFKSKFGEEGQSI